MVPQECLIRLEQEVPFPVGALLSCGIPTGWGSAVYAGAARPGETVAVVGVGGVGINAVQGAALAGASHVIAVDPVEMHRQVAMELRATHSAETAEEAAELARTLSWGTGADLTIVTAGVVTSEIVSGAYAMTGKGGRLVLTGMPDIPTDITVELMGAMVSSYGIRVIGTLAGDCNIQYDVPRLARLYHEGRLKIDELITRTYTLDEIQDGYDDQAAGRLIRGVVNCHA